MLAFVSLQQEHIRMVTGRYDHNCRKLIPSQSPRLPPITEIIVNMSNPINWFSWTFTLKNEQKEKLMWINEFVKFICYWLTYHQSSRQVWHCHLNWKSRGWKVKIPLLKVDIYYLEKNLRLDCTNVEVQGSAQLFLVMPKARRYNWVCTSDES